jgi:hypothetical protein
MDRLITNYNAWKDVRNNKIISRCNCKAVQWNGNCICLLSCVLCGKPESDCKLHLCETHRRYSAAIQWSIDGCFDLLISSSCIGHHQENGDLWYISKSDALNWTRNFTPAKFDSGYFFSETEKHVYPLTLKVEEDGNVLVKMYCRKTASTFPEDLEERFFPISSLNLTVFGSTKNSDFLYVSSSILATFAKFSRKMMHPASFHLLPRNVKKEISLFVCGHPAYFIEPSFRFDHTLLEAWETNTLPKKYGQIGVSTYYSGEYPMCNLNELVE